MNVFTALKFFNCIFCVAKLIKICNFMHHVDTYKSIFCVEKIDIFNDRPLLMSAHVAKYYVIKRTSRVVTINTLIY